MKIASQLASVALLLPGTALASWLNSADIVSRGDKGCSFEITSSGSFECPAGELSDGQIRLNTLRPFISMPMAVLQTPWDLAVL
jgi:hypothetical protein